MDANGLNFWMLSQQQDWPLPPAPASSGASGVAPNLSSLEAGIGVGDTQIVLTVPLPAGAPPFVSVDSEAMSVTAVDSTALQLNVTRGAQGTAAANHPPGALVWGPVGILNTKAAKDDTQLTIVAAAHGAPAPPAGLSPGVFLQVGGERLIVTAIDWTGMQFTVTRGALGSAEAAYPAGAPVFAPLPSNTLYFCPTSKRLQLRSTRLGNPVVESFTDAVNLVETVPMAQDTFGNYARWDALSRQILSGGSGPGEVPIFAPPAGQAVTDLVMGTDGILYIALGGTLVMVDRRDRWPNFTLAAPGFNFWRLAALPDGGVLALDRSKPQLGKVTGAPLETGPSDTPNPGILRSCQGNASPPTLSATYPLPASETFIGFAGADQQFVLLSWAASSATNKASFLRLFDFDTGPGVPWKLGGILWPYSLAWLGGMRIAALATGLNEALIFNLAESGALVPAGDTYVLSGYNSGPFAHSPSQPPYYTAGTNLGIPVSLSGGKAVLATSALAAGVHTVQAVYNGDRENAPGSSAILVQSVSATPATVTQTAPPAIPSVALSSSPNPTTPGQTVTFTAQVASPAATGRVQFLDGAQLRPLLPLSLNSLAGFGSTDPRTPAITDSGTAQAVWHRIFLEAVLPPRCSIVVWLAAADQPAGITSPTAAWYPHAFGEADMSSLPNETPKGMWLSVPSEVPFAQPLLGGDPPVLNRQGLFMALAQRTGKVVRNLRGRFLGIRVDLQGDRRTTPEIAALRVWSSRFSYVSNYLPELYRENKFSPDADKPGSGTRRDFFERFVNIFEAQLTRIEDRIANSYLLTRPETAPDSALDWLGGWVGLNPAGYPPDRRRARLLASSSLHRQRGTVKGITQALDIATNGLCSRGAVIVVEDFRLRHIFATILGADLDIQNDPLLPGFSGSSNSFVGATLFLGNPKDQAEILALFSASLPKSTAEESQVQQFYYNLAHRMTIFVHNQVEAVDVNLVQKIVECEKPAHVAAAVRLASQPFMVSLAALLGVDSYLAPQPPRDPVVVGTSQIGRYNMVIQAPSLDPRLET